ncbi:MAG: hypothetical protein QF805_30505 [Pirellulaceae bacterium]|jgi:hypothetical protein|nr:hypothetical protein [Pirellulaceae bacterium]
MASAKVVADPASLSVKTIQGYYDFPRDAELRVGDEVVEFAAGDVLQWLETRRFGADQITDLLAQYDLVSVADVQFLGHALHLCQAAEFSE